MRKPLFRAMRAEGGRPIVAPTRRTLGVVAGPEPHGDISPDADGFVEPQTGGLSVVVDDPKHLPAHRKPATLGGTGKDPIFVIDADALPPSLKARQDMPNDPVHHHHYVVEPASRCLFDKFQLDIGGTVGLWSARE